MKSFVSFVVVPLAFVCFCQSSSAQQGLGRAITAYRNGNIIAHSGSSYSGYAANANIIRHSGGIDPGSAIIYGGTSIANGRSFGQYRSQPYGYGGNVYQGRVYSQPYGNVSQNGYRAPQSMSYSGGTVYYSQPSPGPSYAPVYGGNSVEAHVRHAQDVNNLYRKLGYQDGVGGFDSSTQLNFKISPRR